jgi:hypothetical protein
MKIEEENKEKNKMKEKKRGCEEEQTKERAHEQVGGEVILQTCVFGSD